MPKISVVFFTEEDGTVPILDWLDKLPKKAKAKCIAKIERLSLMGHELRRPQADYLRDGIYELRISLQGIQYRILYFFHTGRVVISHGVIKENIIAPKEICKAVKRKEQFFLNT